MNKRVIDDASPEEQGDTFAEQGDTLDEQGVTFREQGSTYAKQGGTLARQAMPHHRPLHPLLLIMNCAPAHSAPHAFD